jgi:hypothetical protein
MVIELSWKQLTSSRLVLWIDRERKEDSEPARFSIINTKLEFLPATFLWCLAELSNLSGMIFNNNYVAWCLARLWENSTRCHQSAYAYSIMMLQSLSLFDATPKHHPIPAPAGDWGHQNIWKAPRMIKNWTWEILITVSLSETNQNSDCLDHASMPRVSLIRQRCWGGHSPTDFLDKPVGPSPAFLFC